MSDTEAPTPDPADASPDGAGPPAGARTPAQVRAAAERLKEAIDAHLSAVEARTGEQDPVVQRAFDALQAAAETYDDLLFEVHDEVTPFEFGAGEVEPVGGPDLEEMPPVVSLFLRRDYALTEPPALLDAGREAHQAVVAAGIVPPDEEEPTQLGAALYTLFQAAGVDGFDENAYDAGLEALGGTVWFVAGDENTLVDGDPDASPFADADPKRLIYRVDEVVND